MKMWTIVSAILLPLAGWAQDTTSLEPASTLPISALIRVDATHILASASVEDDLYQTDSLMLIDVSDPYHPRAEASGLSIVTRLWWDPIHYRPDEHYADAQLIDDLMVGGIVRTFEGGDTAPFTRRTGPFTLNGESLDRSVSWSITIFDSIVEESEDPFGFTNYLLPGRILYIHDLLYWAAGDWGLRLYDISDRSHPAELDTFGYRAREMVWTGSKLVIYEGSDLVALDLSNPRQPRETCRRTLESEEFPFTYPVFSGDSLFALHTPVDSSQLDITVFRFRDDDELDTLGSFQLPISSPHPTYWINSGRLYLCEYSTMRVYEVGDGFDLQLFGRFTFSGHGDYNPYNRIYPYGRMFFVYNPVEAAWMEMPVAYLYDLDQNGVSDNSVPMPSSLSLSSFPNPFNSSTTIEYSLPRPGRYALSVVDISGREVARLAEGWKEAGSYRAIWMANAMASGRYQVILQNGNRQQVSPLILLK